MRSSILPLLTFDTAIIGIGGEAGRTELADGLVVLHLAGRPIRALLLLAGVPALVADAGLAGRTPPILQTDGDGGVAALHAHAHRLVVQHLALLALGTGGGGRVARIAGAATASRLAAGLVGGTVGVLAALHLPVGAGQRPLMVDHQAVLALAGRLVAGDDTFLVRLAEE